MVFFAEVTFVMNSMELLRLILLIVACEVVSRSPIVYSDQTIAHSSLCASVPLEDCGLAISQAISNYFLLLTGLRADWLRRGVIMYTCANYGKHMVSKVYLTSDPSMAVVMFSYMGDKKPGSVFL